MAEAYLRKRFAEEGLEIEVRSAGTFGMNGIAPTEETIKVLSDGEVDTEGLESKELTEELIEWADLILVMEPSHKVKAKDMVAAKINIL